MEKNQFVGTSGFSYPEWKGVFYPEDLPSRKYLAFYASRFRTTEINNTFYRLPTTRLTEGWAGEVPDSFSFTLKLSRRITHQKKLRDVDEEMQTFLKAASALKKKMGPILVQLPPFLKKDTPALQMFVQKYAGQAMLAFEFRHSSWFEEETYRLLGDSGSALAVVEGESEDLPPVREVTGRFLYMRLRKSEYAGSELQEWAKWIRAQKLPVYCYLKHEQKAPLLAQQLLDLL